MRKIIVILLLSFTSLGLMANDVDVVVEPKEPILNESFYVTFKVRVTGGEEPYISFTPYGASVMGKRSQGLSISTVVINGKFTTTREQAIVYELMAEREGQVHLRDIKVEMDGKTVSVNDVRVNVIKEPRSVPDAFIEAEASKTKVFLGEGINVNYYLYFKNSISANDVREFPKLNRFIKRFHHINSPVETVQYKGQVLRRILAYSARLYPEKVGPAVLDPMKISVQVIENSRTGYGFSTQRFKNVDLSSQQVEIEVLPLPAEGVPSGFTRLVGEHEFKLSIPKNKYLVNEPIEIKLEVTGKGALENLEAPVIYTHNNLEQFDTNSEIKELDTQSARKTFEYTILPRGALKLEERKLSIAYFDPEQRRYVEKFLEVPALEVGGGTIATQSNYSEKNQTSPGNNMKAGATTKNPIIPNAIGIMGPNMAAADSWFQNIFLLINSSLAVAIFGISAHWAFASGISRLFKFGNMENARLQRNLKKQLNYSDLYHLLSKLDKGNKMAQGGISITDLIEKSELGEEAKAYFKRALSSVEGGVYGQGRKNGVEIYNKKHFNELMKNI